MASSSAPGWLWHPAILARTPGPVHAPAPADGPRARSAGSGSRPERCSSRPGAPDQPAQQIGRRTVHDHRIGVRAERPAALPVRRHQQHRRAALLCGHRAGGVVQQACPRRPAAGRTGSPRRPGRPRAATPRAPASRGSRRPGWAGRRRCAPAPARSARPARRAPHPASRRSRPAPGAACPPRPWPTRSISAARCSRLRVHRRLDPGAGPGGEPGQRVGVAGQVADHVRPGPAGQPARVGQRVVGQRTDRAQQELGPGTHPRQRDGHVLTVHGALPIEHCCREL